MDTLLILRDSITANVVKVVDTCQSCVQVDPTNCNDVKIVAIICATIVIVALVAWGVINSLKCTELCVKEKNKEAKRTEEETERQNRTNADSKQRKIDLQNKLLTFLEKNTSKGDYNKDKQDFISALKDINTKESQYYIKVLKALIDNAEIPEYPK